MSGWTSVFYEDDAGRRPVELWMDSLTIAEFAALRAAILRGGVISGQARQRTIGAT